MKLAPCVSIQNSSEPGLLAVRFDYKYESLREELKQLAGVTWNPREKYWFVAEEYLDEVEGLARRHGLAPLKKLMPMRASDAVAAQAKVESVQLSVDPRLHPYQAQGVLRSLQAKRFMLNFEMGLGKTPTAIEVLKQTKAQHILIVCPAMVRETWLTELTKWGVDAKTRLISSNVQWDTRDACLDGFEPRKPVVEVTSYSLLGGAIGTAWDAIFFDESHYIKERASARSKQALELRERNPDAIILLLTATPITSEPQDLWHQLEVMYPGRFGTYWQFVKRYCVTSPNEWGGIDVHGVNDQYADELKKRLAAVSMRVTKHEVAHLLPPFTTIPTVVEIGSKRLKEMNEEFSEALSHKSELNNFVLQAGTEKVPYTVERVLDVVRGGQSHVMVLTWFRATAQAIKDALQVPNTLYINGDWSPSERTKALDEVKKAKSGIVIATMASIREGIDLTKFSYVIFAELYWQHAMVEQTLGRYHRLSSQVPGTAEFLIIKGTLDEIIARTLLRRGKNIDKVFKRGVAGEKMSEALGTKEPTEEEAMQELRDIAAKRDEFDEYT